MLVHPYYTYWFEVLQGLAGKLGRDGMTGEGFIKVDQGGGRGDISPVEEMVELRT